MAQLAEHMPINVGDVVSCLHPVPPIVRRRAVEIARIVETAKQRKRRPSELLAMSPDTVPIVQDNNSTSPSSSSHKIVEGDDWRVLRHLASECKMRHVSWSLEKNKEDDIIETAEHDVVGDLYVSNTSQDLDSLDSVRRELTEKIRSKSSRLWKALTRVDEDEDVMHDNKNIDPTNGDKGPRACIAYQFTSSLKFRDMNPLNPPASLQR